MAWGTGPRPTPRGTAWLREAGKPGQRPLPGRNPRDVGGHGDGLPETEAKERRKTPPLRNQAHPPGIPEARENIPMGKKEAKQTSDNARNAHPRENFSPGKEGKTPGKETLPPSPGSLGGRYGKLWYIDSLL